MFGWFSLRQFWKFRGFLPHSCFKGC
uniref:Uncharacterized protein n=1 Tax=Rhizophora mucronata TaxID=61149 RepID=A0A2P2QU26_RHIMU